MGELMRQAHRALTLFLLAKAPRHHRQPLPPMAELANSVQANANDISVVYHHSEKVPAPLRFLAPRSAMVAAGVPR